MFSSGTVFSLALFRFVSSDLLSNTSSSSSLSWFGYSFAEILFANTETKIINKSRKRKEVNINKKNNNNNNIFQAYVG